MDLPFRVRIAVRSYELDSLGHVNQAVYHSYAEHARVELVRAAGVPSEVMVRAGTGPVLLASEIRYLSELTSGDEIDVTAEVVFGTGKTFQMNSTISKADGTVSAQLRCTVGLMDLTARKLLADPAARFAELATKPELLGLSNT